MKFAELFTKNMVKKSLNEELNDINSINSTHVGYLITYTLFMTSQIHIWHLICTDAHKHSALDKMYKELELAVDVLAERFLTLGGNLTAIDEKLVMTYSNETVIKRIEEFRDVVTSCITNDPFTASIDDAIVDLQEILDSAIYSFKLN